VAVPDDAVAAIGDAAVAAAAGCLLVERHALAVHRLLDDAGVDHRFLKGFTAAHRFGGDPAWRTFVDVDVLVPGHRLDEVVAALESAGHRRLQPEWRPGFAARYGKSVTLRSDDGIEVDLHRVLASGPFGLVAGPGPLWAAPPAVVEVGGERLPCLDAAAAFVHACVHAVTGQRPTLSTLRDVARIRTAAPPGAVADLERALGVEACVTSAAALAVERLSLPGDTGLRALGGRPVGRRQRRWLALYAPADHRFRRLALAGATAVPGVRGKLAYAWALARP
jgi:hypothetical protein